MKKLILLFVLLVSSGGLFSQTLFLSTQEVGKKQITPTPSLKQKVAEISKRPIGTDLGEFSGIFDKDFYLLSNGSFSYGPEVSYMHYRLIFDSNENWIETQELFHSDVLPEETYYQILPKMKKSVSKKYAIDDYANFIKITNPMGFWYEVDAKVLPLKKKKNVTLVFDKDLKLKNAIKR